MKALKDFEFTAFVSYSHSDDEAWFNWVGSFAQELERSLSAMLRGVRLPRLHLSAENGPSSPPASDAENHRLDASFALIVVVHDSYAHSERCLQEVEHFKAAHGAEALRDRLYFVAMSESAMHRVARSDAWKRLLPPDAVWMPFFDTNDTDRPLEIYLGPGLVAPAFRAPFERLRIDLAAKLRRAAAAIEPPPPAPAPKPTSAGLVFISHATEDLPWAEAVVVALEAEGQNCWLAARDIVPGAVAYSGEIAKAIKRSRLMVALVSRHASASAHVAREVSIAFERNLPVVPVKIDDEPLGDSLEYFFTAAQMLIVAGRARERALLSLLKAVQRHPSG